MDILIIYVNIKVILKTFWHRYKTCVDSLLKLITMDRIIEGDCKKEVLKDRKTDFEEFKNSCGLL